MANKQTKKQTVKRLFKCSIFEMEKFSFGAKLPYSRVQICVNYNENIALPFSLRMRFSFMKFPCLSAKVLLFSFATFFPLFEPDLNLCFAAGKFDRTSAQNTKVGCQGEGKIEREKDA